MHNEGRQLLIDCCGGSELRLDLNESVRFNESRGPHGLVKFRGKFQEADAINKNKRSYPFKVLDENVRKLQEAIGKRRLLGELDHPTDSIVHFTNASHVITKLWWEGQTLMGEGEILTTPSGQVMQALLECGIGIGISSRGIGQGTTNEDGILVIGEGYKLITFDAVADPSTYEAWQERIVNKRNESEIVTRTNSINSAAKNESSGIDTVSQEAFIACLEQFIQAQVEKV